MTDPHTNPNRDPTNTTYRAVGDQTVTEGGRGMKGMLFVLGGIVVALGVLFWLVADDGADTPTEAPTGVVIEGDVGTTEGTAPAPDSTVAPTEDISPTSEQPAAPPAETAAPEADIAPETDAAPDAAPDAGSAADTPVTEDPATDAPAIDIPAEETEPAN